MPTIKNVKKSIIYNEFLTDSTIKCRDTPPVLALQRSLKMQVLGLCRVNGGKLAKGVLPVI